MLLILELFALVYSYIAKTLYGDDDDEEDAPQKNTNIDEPKLIGLHPVSNEKVCFKFYSSLSMGLVTCYLALNELHNLMN